MPQFGHHFKEKYFQDLEKDVVLINHGSYGTTPSMVIDEQIKAAREHENYPDRFQLFTGGEKYIEQVKALTDYLNLQEVWKNVVLVTNATIGVNTVLRSYPWNFQKDKVLIHSTTYGACANTVEFLSDYYGLQYEIVQLSYPMEDVDVVAKFEEKLAHGGFTMCMFDLISSIPGVTLPYENLIKLCHKYNVLSLVDGAHGAGLVDFQFIKTCKPTFLVSNLHKWLSVPKSCAMLYVDPKFHSTIQSFPISWNYHLKPSSPDMLLLEKFAKTGTNSYTSYMCIKKAIEFRSEICGGEANINKYQIELRQKAAPKIIEIWSKGATQDRATLLENSTSTLSSPGMFSIRYPIDKIKYRKVYEKLVSDPSYYVSFNAKYLDLVVKKYKTYSIFGIHNNELYFRFSPQIFNEVEDFVIGAKVIDKAVSEILDQELSKFNAESINSKL
ncbi:hypothetical protein ACO0QE_000684 [Hanseniaspora vineae]